jgi:hypothetical protein
MKRLWLAALLVGLSCFFATSGFAALISGVTIESVSSEFTDYGWDLTAVHTVDGSGLVGGGHNQAGYPGGAEWQTISQTGTAKIVFDLGGVYTLDKLHVWNLNFYDPCTGRGAQNVNISTSTDQSSWASAGSYVFTIATGQNGDPGFDITATGWNSARYIQFDILTNWGGGDNAGHVGLSEVQFHSAAPVPIPAAVWLFGTGVLGLFGVRRKFIK